MALYEYVCGACGARFEKRMPMSEVVQVLPCTACGKPARKAIGQFAVTGVATEGVGDGPAPWEDDGSGDGLDGGDDFGGFGGHGHSHDFGHGHSHGPGTHTH
jgi:putative FmdB family regulatory protein